MIKSSVYILKFLFFNNSTISRINTIFPSPVIVAPEIPFKSPKIFPRGFTTISSSPNKSSTVKATL